MREVLNKVLQRYAACKSRERILVVATLVALVITLWTNLVYHPLAMRSRARVDEVANLQTTLNNLHQQQTLLEQSRSQDPNQELKTRLQRTQEAITKLDSELKEKLKGLIEPRQMASVLEAMLKQNEQLQLQRIQSLGATPLLDSPESEADTVNDKPVRSVEVYRHGLEIEFTGSYHATLSYLQALQQLPWEFYWDAVRYEVEKYPNARVVITVHTLSLREGWIGV